MQKKLMAWKTKGMNQDLSVSAFNPEFSFENMNLRLSTNEGNTLMSWVNERGTKKIESSLINIDIQPWVDASENTPGRYSKTIDGATIGTAIINHQLILFTTKPQSKDKNKRDSIYVLTYNKEDGRIQGYRIFNGNLNFSIANPIETLVSFEADEIQKVYWVDGENQPRIINIKASKEKMRIWNTYSSEKKATFFDFNPAIDGSGTIEVVKENLAGTFAPGTIQYAFCYLNLYSQQSSIVSVSPLYYITHTNNGASPEDSTSCSFKITIDTSGIGVNFNYVRLFSIQRTSLDSTPIVKHLLDLSVKEADEENKLYYRDTGASGSSVDPMALLYTNRVSISAKTIAEKNNTLFLGNITDLTEQTDDFQAYFDKLRNDPDPSKRIQINFIHDSHKTVNIESSEGTIYKNSFMLNKSQWDVSTFKGGETYRFGIQLRDINGTWTNPIFIDDYSNSTYPSVEKTGGQLVSASTSLSLDFLKGKESQYIAIRPLVVHPTPADRKVLYQGVLNPTVFQANARKNPIGGVTAQASWFFRPMEGKTKDKDSYGQLATYKHFEHLPYAANVQKKEDGSEEYTANLDAEIYGAEALYENPFDLNAPEDITKNTTQFFVDQSIVTLNSPDIELAEDVLPTLPEDVKLRIVGAVPITANCSYTHIESSSKEAEISKEIVPDYTRNNLSYIAGQRLISDYLWQDSLWDNAHYFIVNGLLHYEWEKEGPQVSYKHNWVHQRATEFVVNPWHANVPLSNDWNSGTTLLKKKVTVTQLFSHFTQYQYTKTGFKLDYSNISAGLYNPINRNSILLAQQNTTSTNRVYTGYSDTVLLNSKGIKPLIDTTMIESDEIQDDVPVSKFSDNKAIQDFVAQQTWNAGGARENNLVPLQYDSTAHAVIAFKAESSENIPILPCVNNDIYNTNVYEGFGGKKKTFWGDTMLFEQLSPDGVKNFESFEYSFLWLGELYRENTNEFGGKTRAAIKDNVWLVGGPEVKLDNKNIDDNNEVKLYWLNGDTYYQRYDCLKTFPLTKEDVNQNTEILSFMCETRINLDGRYDKFRGTSKKILPVIDQTTINHINPVYTQKDNFFTNRIVENEDIESMSYPNYICFSKTKQSASDVDAYTDISMANVLEMDGDKGEVTALRKFNDQIIAFQDRSVAQVLYDENVQIQSTQGVPIEIANSGKVQGKRYISDTIGCSDKYSIVSTPSGLYFIDSNDKSIYLFNGQLNNISTKGGFSTWCKKNIPSGDLGWDSTFPTDYLGHSSFRGYYDKLNQDVLYVNNKTALAFSEKLGAFTSFYDYGDIPFFENLDDIGMWISNNEEGTTDLWVHQAGEYGSFFNVNKPYWMTLIGNPDLQMDKTFTNMEFRASVEGDGELNIETDKFTPTIPFDSLETWNEYQHGIAKLDIGSGHSAYQHHLFNSTDASLKRKFRIWRCDIPRDNAPISPEDEEPMGIYRMRRNQLDRMRNPWLYLKLSHSAVSNSFLKKVELHDFVMTYFC